MRTAYYGWDLLTMAACVIGLCSGARAFCAPRTPSTLPHANTCFHSCACKPPLRPSRSAHGLQIKMVTDTAESTETHKGIVNVDFHAASLRENGYTVIAAPVVGEELVERARVQCRDRLADLLDKVKAAGCDPLEQQYRFKEIAKRQRNRWDLQLHDPSSPKSPASTPTVTGEFEELESLSSTTVTWMDAPDDPPRLSPLPLSSASTWEELCRAALEVAVPIIRGEQGEAFKGATCAPIMVGAVISRPGARVQRFHCDATHEHFAAAKADPSHRIYNIFIPLVDVPKNADGTQFWGAPQLEKSALSVAGHFLPFLNRDGKKKTKLPRISEQIDAPACSAGGLMMYDYRTIHRGLANPMCGGRERAVAYVIVATGGAQEGYNFPEWSIEEPIDPEIISEFPFFNELKGRGRDSLEDSLEYSTEIEGPDRFAIPIEFSCLNWGLGGGASNFFSKTSRLLLALETKLNP